MNSKFKITKCWSDGSKYEKSKRPEPINETANSSSTANTISTANSIAATLPTSIETTFNNQIMSNGETVHSRDTNNRREDTCIKIASREMFNKINQNPFLLGHDYAMDIGIQNQFLMSRIEKPINEDTRK